MAFRKHHPPPYKYNPPGPTRHGGAPGYILTFPHRKAMVQNLLPTAAWRASPDVYLASELCLRLDHLWQADGKHAMLHLCRNLVLVYVVGQYQRLFIF